MYPMIFCAFNEAEMHTAVTKGNNFLNSGIVKVLVTNTAAGKTTVLEVW